MVAAGWQGLRSFALSYLRPDMDNFGDVQLHCDRISPKVLKLLRSKHSRQVKQAKEVFAWFDRDQDGYWNRHEASGQHLSATRNMSILLTDEIVHRRSHVTF